MKWFVRLAVAVLFGIAVHPAVAQESRVSRPIRWSKDLPAAMAKAKESGKVLMACINEKHVDGRTDEEPAAKGLREVVYKDARVVEKSKEFVCVLLTSKGSSEEYDALRKLGIDGDIISPQHVFIAPEGDRIVRRKSYWSHGKGEKAVEALLKLMTEAQENAATPGADEADASDPPPESDGRAKWIADLIEKIVTSESQATKEKAAEELVAADKDGDCTTPLIALLEEHKKDVVLLVPVIRALGRDGLEAAALPVSDFLKHKDDDVRGNAAVSLEYIGSKEKKVVDALKKAAGKDKNVAIANHAYRALGRCGTEDASARSALLKQASSGKSEFASYGACIGLAYFEGDAKAARGVEKLLKTIGIPGSRRGGGQNAVKRGLVSWVLAEIGDPKSVEFVDEELIARLKNVKAFWVQGLTVFWEATSRACGGDKASLAAVKAGVGQFVRFAKDADLGRYGAEDGNLMDSYREGRKKTPEFEPKGEGMLDVDE